MTKSIKLKDCVDADNNSLPNGVKTDIQDNEKIYEFSDIYITGTTNENGKLLDNTNSDVIFWNTYENPTSIKDYLVNAIEISSKDYSSNYQITDGTDLIYYNDESKNLTISPTGNDPAIIDGSDPEDLEANIRTDGNVVLKGIANLVSCDGLDDEVILAQGLSDLNDYERKKNCCLALLDNYSEDQCLSILADVKLLELTGDNFDAIVTCIEGA